MKTFNTAVILAGGKSSRMGFDKQLLEANNIRIIEENVNKLKREFDEIIIVTNEPSYYNNMQCKIIADEILAKGPLSGIHIGLKTATSKYVYFTACDMPVIDLDYIKYMKNILRDKNIDGCIAKINDQLQPFNAFYATSIIDDIENALSSDKRGLTKFINDMNFFCTNECIIEKFNTDIFLNLNTNEDYENYCKSIRSEHGYDKTI